MSKVNKLVAKIVELQKQIDEQKAIEKGMVKVQKITADLIEKHPKVALIDSDLFKKQLTVALKEIEGMYQSV